jgi:hypothetical protein
LDPRLEPTPDYGTLGLGGDVAAGSCLAAGSATPFSRVAPWLAITTGMSLALMLGIFWNTRRAHPGSAHDVRGDQVPSANPSPTSATQLERMQPQKQAEALLEQAVAHSDGAVDQISSRVDRWQGKLHWDSQMATLTTAALNSNDLRVRESAIEVELAAYGLAKNAASLEYLLKTAESSDRAQKAWALWALGLMGNRGVRTDQVTEVLTAHLKDSDEDSRHWAVEGLALAGGNDTIPVLLAAMHDDPSPLVREEAACGIAQSGMFTREQRLSAVPQLLSYTDDSALDARTHGWAFQALSDITGQRLPNSSAAWRSWYENRN